MTSICVSLVWKVAAADLICAIQMRGMDVTETTVNWGCVSPTGGWDGAWLSLRIP